MELTNQRCGIRGKNYRKGRTFDHNATFQKEVETLEPGYSRQVEKLSQDEIDEKLSKFMQNRIEEIGKSKEKS